MNSRTTKGLLGAIAVLLCLNLVAQFGVGQTRPEGQADSRRRSPVVGIAAIAVPEPSTQSTAIVVFRAYGNGAIEAQKETGVPETFGSWKKWGR
jgi:hypothetical protein